LELFPEAVERVQIDGDRPALHEEALRETKYDAMFGIKPSPGALRRDSAVDEHMVAVGGNGGRVET
jgi:hypothetical protein